MLKEENDKLYLKKELFFNKDKFFKNLIKENHNRNNFFNQISRKDLSI